MGTLTAQQLLEELQALTPEQLARPVSAGCCVDSSGRHDVLGLWAGAQRVTLSCSDETTGLNDGWEFDDDDEEDPNECVSCGAKTDDGEGFDGRCGNCADTEDPFDHEFEREEDD